MQRVLDSVTEIRNELDNLEEAVKLERELHADEVGFYRDALKNSERTAGYVFLLGCLIGACVGSITVILCK